MIPPRPGQHCAAARARPRSTRSGTELADVARLRRASATTATYVPGRHAPPVARCRPSVVRRLAALAAPSTSRPVTRPRARAVVRQISTDGRRPGAKKRIAAGSPSGRGSSSGARRCRSPGRSTARAASAASCRAAMLRGTTTERPWRRRTSRGRYVPSGDALAVVVAAVPRRRARARRRGPAVLDELAHLVAVARRRSSASTSSPRLSTNAIRARSKRPSRLGEKTGVDAELLDDRRRALQALGDEERGERRDHERGESALGEPRHRRMSSPLGTVHSW